MLLYKPCKRPSGAFYRNEFDRHLRESGSNTVVFAGCNFPKCPQASIYQASERDYRIVMVSDAIPGLYERGIDECRAIGTHVQDLSETLDWLARRGSCRADATFPQAARAPESPMR